MEMAEILHEKLNYTTHEVKALHLHMIYAHRFEEILIDLGQSNEMTDIILMAMGEAQCARLNLALHELADHQLQKTQKNGYKCTGIWNGNVKGQGEINYKDGTK